MEFQLIFYADKFLKEHIAAVLLFYSQWNGVKVKSVW